MKTKNIIFVIVITVLLICQQSSGQDIKKNITENKKEISKINPGGKPEEIIYTLSREKFVPQDRQVSEEEINLKNKLMIAKEKGSGEEMLRIQKKLDRYQGSVTKQEPSSAVLEEIKMQSTPGDNIVVTPLFTGPNVKAVTIQREQIGSINRMWAMVAHGSSGRDTVFVFYSDDDGNNWYQFSFFAFYSYSINADEIDAEIVQTSFQKFLYVVCGLNNAGKKVVGMMVIDITALPFAVGIGQVLLWPGDNISNLSIRHYRPRITSDAANYQYSNAWMYIACSYDILSGGNYTTGQKAARINNPYSTSPSITYKSNVFYLSTVTGTAQDAHCDLAYYNDYQLGPSIMVIESGVADSTLVYLSNSTIADFTSIGSPSGALIGASSPKTHAYISSNGNYGYLMITDNQYYDALDYDIQFFRTTNGGLSWSTGYVDYTANYSTRADILERKNVPGEFFLAYADLAQFDPVHFCKASGGVWGSIVPQLNHLDASISASPRPCFRISGGDSCFAIWSQYSSSNAWVSGGCSGSIVVNKKLQLKLYIQGRYRETGDYMYGDTLQVELRNNFAPYNLFASARNFVNHNGDGSFYFPSANNGTNYFLVMKHRNSIQTWSKTPGQSFSSDLLNYDFSTGTSQAYGSNLAVVDLLPSRFGIFTGDINQDESVDVSDIVLTYNDANIFLSGYVQTDVTGDNFVDASDVLLVYNNSINFVSVIRP